MTSSSWERKLCKAISDNDVDRFKTVLRSVRDTPELAKAEWKYMEDPLHFAASIGSNEMISLLIEAGANINSKTRGHSGKATALHLAVKSLQTQTDTIKLLIDLGADKTIIGNWDNLSGTPLQWAHQIGNRTEFLPMLDTDSSSMRSSSSSRSNPVANHVGKFLSKRISAISNVVSTDAIGIIKVSTMDDIAKNKAAKEAEMKKAKEINEKISVISQKLLDIRRQKTLLKREERELETKMARMKAQEGYKTSFEMIQLKKQLHELNRLSESQRLKRKYQCGKEGDQEQKDEEEDDDKVCPICMEKPEMVFSCEECDNWFCQGCSERMSTCPLCRVDFHSRPPRRNRTVERILDI